MKFLCDRCKTRYSIADERVRGKILKIRCKNCANVISVREGMTDADDAAAAPPAPAPAGSALQNAFASVMVGTRPGETQPPPPVLEEEWYVAIDGNQSGPFTLAEAQAWVGAQAATDELFCWCEGFDDWLPVEKVSHFRGLRRTAAKEETPRPRVTGGHPLASGPTAPSAPSARKAAEAKIAPAAPEPREEEPKPLFAATLAKLEAESGALPLPSKNGEHKAAKPEAAKEPAKPADRTGGADRNDKKLPAPLAPLTPSSRAPLPMPTRSNSGPVSGPVGRGAQGAVASAAPAIPRAEGNAARDLRPEPAKPMTPAPAKPATPLPAPSSAKPATPTPKPGGARRPLFDTGEPEHEELDDSALQPEPDDGTDGLDLDIGEVSRVVRLPDLMAAAAARPAKAKSQVGRTSGGQAAIARGTGAAPSIAAAAGAAALGNATSPAGGDALPPLSDAVLADAQPPLSPSVAHRPNHNVMWMIGGVVLLLGVIVVAAVAASAGSGDSEQVSTGNLDVTGLGYTYDPLRPRGSDSGTGSGSVAISGVHVIRRPSGGNNGGNNGGQQIQNGTGSTGRQEIGPNGEPILPLTGDDIIQVSQKMSMGTSRCYERALKKDPFLTVQKIMVSLKVDVAGVVTDVSLDGHANDDLGQCLTAAIRRWPFRRSTEGINTVFPLVFQQH